MAGRTAWTVFGEPLLIVAAAVLTLVAGPGGPNVGRTDFRTFYQSGAQYLAGADAYTPFEAIRGQNLNPPWFIAMTAPLCRLPLSAAIVVWWVSGFACFITAILLISREVAPGQAIAL